MVSVNDFLTLITMVEPLGYVEGEETSFESTPDRLAERLGYPTWFTITRENLFASLNGLIEHGIAYEPWTIRLARDAPFVVLFTNEAEAVHFRLLAG